MKTKITQLIVFDSVEIVNETLYLTVNVVNNMFDS